MQQALNAALGEVPRLEVRTLDPRIDLEKAKGPLKIEPASRRGPQGLLADVASRQPIVQRRPPTRMFEVTAAELALHQLDGHDLVGERRLVAIWQDAIEEIPDTLASLPPCDGDLAGMPQDLQHARKVLAVVPASRPPRDLGAVIEVAGEERSAFAQLVQDVGAEPGVVTQPLGDVAAARVLGARVAAHHRAVERQIGHRDQVGDVFEELARLVLEHAAQVLWVVGAVSAEEGEALRAVDNRGRVHLHFAEPFQHLKQR